MKKIIIFALIFVLNLSLVNADILPDITRDQKLIGGKNILNVYDYPEWTFFQRVFKYGYTPFEIILDDGNLGCGGGSVWIAMEIWAIKDILKVDDIIKEYNEINAERNYDSNVERNYFTNEKEIYSRLTEKGAIKLSESGDFKFLGCSIVANKNYDGDVITNYLKIDLEMFYLPRELRLKLNVKLSNETKENLKTLVEMSYEKFKINLKKLPDDKQENTVKILISEIDNLLKEKRGESVMFALSYLKYLSISE